MLNFFHTTCYVNATGSSAIFPPPRFDDWFPFYYGQMKQATDQCQTTISTYIHANESSGPLPGQNSTPCALVQNCLLNSLDEEVKANMGSSNVILGLIPTILSFIGPKMREIVPLLLERPLLGSLISFGSPAVSTVQLFSDFEFKTKEQRPILAALRRRFALYRQGKRARSINLWITGVSAVEYTVLAGALFNQIDNTLKLGRRVIIEWHCTFNVTGQLLLLIFIGFVGQWIAAVSVMLRAHGSLIDKGLPPQPLPPSQVSNGDQTYRTGGRKSTFRERVAHKTISQIIRLLAHLRYLASRELTPQCFRPDSFHQRHFHRPSIFSDFLYLFASAAPLALYLYGTLVFSSFLFISTNDAALVTFRYIGTSLVCRMVLFFELESMA